MKLKPQVPEHITDKDEIAAWLADQEEQAALNAKIKAEAAAKNEAASAVVEEVAEEAKPAPKKKATRKKKA